MKILVTGGSGYIGSHTCVQLLNAGHSVVIVDNLCNSQREVLERIANLSGQPPVFCEVDICDFDRLDAVFATHKIDAVVHFAGLKAVGESCEKPLLYYQNNVAGSVNLFNCMSKHEVKNLVFSSSATVYGDPEMLPVVEASPLSATNPYGQSKLMIEEICRDLASTQQQWKIVLLRYFNPVGAHVSGTIGEDPNGIPNNLLPYVSQVASGKLAELTVFGDDYDTPDGTGVRDYIHVEDLSAAHVKALNLLQRMVPSCEAINVGTGVGYSVLDIVKSFEQVTGQNIPLKIGPRRAGDIATSFADAQKAQQLLDWTAQHKLEDMVADAWRWQSANPLGYDTSG